MKQCAICLKDLKKEKNKSLIVKYKTSNGIKDILVQNLSYSYCSNCDEFFYSPAELEHYETQLEKALEDERKKEGLLTAKEIKAIRTKYGLTQIQLEKLLDIGPKNVAKWETYRSNQSKNIDRILRIMDKDIFFFIKLLSSVNMTDFRNVYEKNSLYINNYPALEVLTTIYPDITYTHITSELINKVNTLIKDAISNKVMFNKNRLTIREAI
jgi:putative zinc finger/helix-turn-helix YgiT family protein